MKTKKEKQFGRDWSDGDIKFPKHLTPEIIHSALFVYNAPKEEAKKHDELFLCEIMATLEDKKLGTGASKHWQTMRKHLNWFRQHNAKAYMVLLD